MKRLLSILAALALVYAGVPAWAGAGSKDLAQKRYETERARCEAGTSGQSLAACLREAAASRDEARKGNLETLPNTELARNAIERCNNQPADDRPACVQRIMGAGSTQGSVEGGGVIRQTETPVKP